MVTSCTSHPFAVRPNASPSIQDLEKYSSELVKLNSPSPVEPPITSRRKRRWGASSSRTHPMLTRGVKKLKLEVEEKEDDEAEQGRNLHDSPLAIKKSRCISPKSDSNLVGDASPVGTVPPVDEVEPILDARPKAGPAATEMFMFQNKLEESLQEAEEKHEREKKGLRAVIAALRKENEKLEKQLKAKNAELIAYQTDSEVIQVEENSNVEPTAQVAQPMDIVVAVVSTRLFLLAEGVVIPHIRPSRLPNPGRINAYRISVRLVNRAGTFSVELRRQGFNFAVCIQLCNCRTVDLRLPEPEHVLAQQPVPMEIEAVLAQQPEPMEIQVVQPPPPELEVRVASLESAVASIFDLLVEVRARLPPSK